MRNNSRQYCTPVLYYTPGVGWFVAVATAVHGQVGDGDRGGEHRLRAPDQELCDDRLQTNVLQDILLLLIFLMCEHNFKEIKVR